MKYLKSRFLNLQGNVITVSTSRLVNALVVDQDQLYKAFIGMTGECLCSCIEQKLNYNDTTKVATFTGLADNDEFCYEEEAHNVQSLKEACRVWGLDAEYFE